MQDVCQRMCYEAWARTEVGHAVHSHMKQEYGMQHFGTVEMVSAAQVLSQGA